MSAPALTAPYFASAAILGLAGVVKVWRPDDTARALVAAGLPFGRRAVRLGAVAELAVCVAAFAVPGPVSASLVAASYAAFTAFIVLAARRGWVIASCGCFGRSDTRPTFAHALLDLVASACAVSWAAANPGRLSTIFFHQPWHGAPLVLVTLLIAGVAYLVWTNPVPGASR